MPIIDIPDGCKVAQMTIDRNEFHVLKAFQAFFVIHSSFTKRAKKSATLLKKSYFFFFSD